MKAADVEIQPQIAKGEGGKISKGILRLAEIPELNIEHRQLPTNNQTHKLPCKSAGLKEYSF
jgi:lysophospholipid acyltransferase (LPLAT)-like uncharacterized protein